MENKIQEELLEAIIAIMERHQLSATDGVTETLNAVTQFLACCAIGLGMKTKDAQTAFIKDMYQQIIDQL